jgi:GDP-4-dehydro-6-deoxy-D-mannose reductase
MSTAKKSRPRILITGVTGFVGRHLVRHLESVGSSELWGTSRQDPAPADWPSGVRRLKADLTEPRQVRKLLAKCRPTQIYHLAGQASVARSWESPAATYVSNIHGQLNLFEALLHLKLFPRVLVVGSSDEYGALEPSEIPVRETNPLRPMSPYGISKVAQDLMGYQYFRASKLPVIRTRAFNHTGPGRPASYALSGFASQFVRMELGLQPPVLHVGDLSVRRDYLDVRDVVHAYEKAITKGVPGEVYNICAGHSYRLQDIVEMMRSRSHIKISIKQDPDRLRPADFPVICGDPSKFRKLTGWKPRIPIERTVDDLMTYWRGVWSRTRS